MKNLKIISLAAVSFGLAASLGQAQVIYSEDFSSAPVVNSTIDNGNTNYAATGVAAEMNQNEWFTRGARGSVTHDAGNGNVDIVINSNIYHLIDLATPENDPGSVTAYTLSFDVTAVSGTVDFFAYAGGGLDYAAANGGSSSGRDTNEGHLYFRTYSTPPSSIEGKQGATLANVVDGTTTTITNTGTFSTNLTLNDVGSAGDYLFIGFGGGSGNSLTIDNIQLTVFSGATVTVEVPDAAAAEQGSDPGTIRLSRTETSGDLDVLYSLSGTADSSDYSESDSGTATITDGNSFVDLVFTPVDDTDYEGDESIQLDLTANGAYLLGATTTGSITITDNEPVPPTVTVSVPDAAADEELSDPGTIRLSRGAETSGDLDVLYTLSGTATSGDYSETYSGTATITDGNSSVDLVFTPVDDSEIELDETIQFDLTADAAYLLGVTTTGVITIMDNEPVTSNGTSYSWLDLYGLVTGGDYEAADLLDSDGDGKLNHEEYSEATDPTGVAMSTVSFSYVDGGSVGATDTLTFAPPNTGWVIEATDNGGTDWGVLPLVSFTVNQFDGTVTATLLKPAGLSGIADPYRVTETASNRKLVVFLAEGQSNMVGWANKGSYDMDDYPCPNMFQLSLAHARSQYVPGSANTVVRAYQPLQTTSHRGGSGTDPFVSLDFYFAREYAKDHPDVDVLVVKNARGSQGFSNGSGSFASGNSMDELAEPYLSAAVAATAQQYEVIEFGGILWHQGEADTNDATNSSAYEAQVTALFARHRADAESHITGATAAPVILGTMSQDWIDSEDTTTYRQVVDAVHRDIGTLVTNASFADLSAISAGIHFSADQYQQIGELYYDAYRNLLNITRKGTSKAWLDSEGLVTGGDYEAADLLDADHDGRLNWVEFRDGTDPVDANSLLQITDLSISGNQLTLTWQAVAGKTYTMWFTPDLANQAWIRQRTGLVGTEPTSLENLQVAGDAGFYSFEAE